MDNATLGSWIVHHGSKLRLVNLGTQAYEQVKLAGMAGRVLSGLAATNQQTLNREQVEALAGTAGVSRRTELPAVLETLEKSALIDRGADGGVSILGATTPTVLEHTSSIFDRLEPTRYERAAIALAELASAQPQLRDEVAERVGDEFKLSSTEVAEFLGDAETIGFTDFSGDDSDRLYFNGNLFRGRESAANANRLLQSLSDDEGKRLISIREELRKKGVLLLDRCNNVLGQKLMHRCISVGLFDLNEVANVEETAHFVTAPAAFNKFGSAAVDDAFDLAKAFVSALAYGINKSRSSRGRISMIDRLLERLIQGHEVGPATAIGEDYRLLELRGVIRVRNDGRGLYHMSLLKRDIGVLAKAVLTTGDASGESLGTLPGAAVNMYTPPEAKRVSVRRHYQASHSRDINEALRAVRTGGRR